MTPTSAPEHTRPPGAKAGRGLLVGLVVLAVVAVPAAVAAYFALASFTGCFLGCSEPEPGVGVLWAGIALLLLAIPVVAGLVAARVRPRRGLLLAVVGAMSLLAIWQLAQTVI